MAAQPQSVSISATSEKEQTPLPSEAGTGDLTHIALNSTADTKVAPEAFLNEEIEPAFGKTRGY